MRRCRQWGVCVVGGGAERHYVLVQPGSPVRGHVVLEHSDETVAQLAMHGGSIGLANGLRVPQRGKLAAQRAHLEALAARIVERRDRGRAA